MSLLQVKNISKQFSVETGIFKKKTGVVAALDNVSFSLKKGSVLGILGESGSGKTTIAKIICRLLKEDSGEILLKNINVKKYSRQDFAKKVQMIFQDPFASLNPKLSIGTILSEAAIGLSKIEKINKVHESLAAVGLPGNILSSYPHQFSGGQRQRIAIARALIKQPEIIIADEPLSALDISIQNQLLDIFYTLKEKQSVAFIFISHDLLSMSSLADNIIIMQNGKIVEEGTAEKVITAPESSYTKRLIDAVPKNFA